jgi:ribonucleoside-triphosphate reductase
MEDTDNKLQRQKCEVYSRIVGYIRPVAQWNDGKQSEFRDRKEYELKD